MDTRPFVEQDLSGLRSAPIEQLKQMSQSMFDLGLLLSSAERLKYLWAVKERIKEELTDPSEWLVSELIRDVIDAIKSYINDRINERLHTAMEAEQATQAEQESSSAEPESQVEGATFTEEEREGLYIVRAICATDVEPHRLHEKTPRSTATSFWMGTAGSQFCACPSMAPRRSSRSSANRSPAWWPLMGSLTSTSMLSALGLPCDYGWHSS